MKLRNVDKLLISKLKINVRAKINRIEKNHNVRLKLPNNFTKILNEAGKGQLDRKQFNKVVRETTIFLNRSNINYQYKKLKSGLSVPRAEYNEANRLVKKINRTRSKLMKMYGDDDFYDFETYAGKVRTGMGSEVISQLQPIKFDEKAYGTIQGFKGKLAVLRQQANEDYIGIKNAIHKENYVKSLQSRFGNRTKDIQDLVSNMSQEDFDDLYYHNFLAHVGFNYDAEDTESKLKMLEMFFSKVVKKGI